MKEQLAQRPFTVGLEEILWGAVLIAITMIMHGTGMLAVLRVTDAVKQLVAHRRGIVAALFPIVLASCLILFVHLTEVAVWAAFFRWKGAFPNPSTAYYFSLNEYTTLGSGFSLPLQWRMLEGVIATAGLMTFAWSTGILFTLAQQFDDQQMQLRKERHAKRSSKSIRASDGASQPDEG